MPRDGKSPERTLTAMIAPHASGEDSTPLLLLAGRADGVPLTGPRFAIVRDGFAIGRSAEEFPLDDPMASGRHAQLVKDGDRFFLEDTGSKNGTFIDGLRISSRTPLHEGARLFVGNHVFVFRHVSSAALEALAEEAVTPLAPVATISPALATLTHKLRRLARTDNEIFLLGETGVGKEVYARAIAAASGRSGAFVPINCAALPRDLVESELFGYRAGAHSTAHAGKPGLIEEAENGTLFLDEMGDMPPEAQTKLLRFLEDKQLTPLGATRSRPIDVRIIAATNRPVAEGSLVRADLLGRLGAAPLVIPPLRDRVEDVGALVHHVFGQLEKNAHPRGPAFETPAYRALYLHKWPLNVRELVKALLAAWALSGDRPIALRDLPDHFSRAPAPPPTVPSTPSSLRATGRKPPSPAPTPEELEILLARHGGNVADVSRALGRQRAAVWRWIKQFGLGAGKHRTR